MRESTDTKVENGDKKPSLKDELISAPAVDPSAPRDPGHLVYIIFYCLGVGTLLPWNFFISVNDYWTCKFRDTRFNCSDNADDADPAAVAAERSPSELNLAWSPNLSVASMVPNVTFLILNAAFGHRLRTQPRLLVSLLLIIVLFIFTAVMVKVPTDDWQYGFMVLTLISVALINTNAAIFQGGLFGVAGKFPPAYMGGIFTGQALGGIFASGVNVIMLACGLDASSAAFSDFIIAVVFLLIALTAYVKMTRSEFFQYYVGESELSSPKKKLSEEEKKFLDASISVDSGIKSLEQSNGDFGGARLPQPPTATLAQRARKPNPLQVMAPISFYAVAVFLVFVVTLGVFPSLTVMVESTEKSAEEPTAWAEKFFLPVACFLLFNIGDFIGRTAAEKLQWPAPSKRGQIIVLSLTLLRFAFIPLFLWCNRAAPVVSPVLFRHDAAYVLIMVLFSVSNGYCSSMCMMSAPQLVKPAEQMIASNVMVACLGVGLGTGALLSKALMALL